MNRKSLIEKIIKTSFLNKEGHIASALSILDCVIALFDHMDPNDNFVLSKGHGSLALYAVLFKKNKITEDEFYSFSQLNSRLGGHPSSHKIPDVLISTGSLGHGMPFAVGLALSKKILKQKGKIFCLIGDGEANEGTIWESALVANTYKLNNLTVIMDFNKSGERAIKMDNPISKFKSFGWETFLIENGNNYEDIISKLNIITSDFPSFIQLNTTKGKGCKIMENNPEWHHKSPSCVEEYDLILSTVY